MKSEFSDKKQRLPAWHLLRDLCASMVASLFVILRKIPTSSLRGVIASRKREAPSLDEMEDAIKDGATARI
jgi:hypothetical protein